MVIFEPLVQHGLVLPPSGQADHPYEGLTRPLSWPRTGTRPEMSTEVAVRVGLGNREVCGRILSIPGLSYL